MEQKETVCSVAKKCGGCRYQGVPYQDQLRKKQKITEGERLWLFIQEKIITT